jgi:hypothetical protein
VTPMTHRQRLVALINLTVFSAFAAVCWFTWPTQRGTGALLLLACAFGFSALTLLWLFLLAWHYWIVRAGGRLAP